MKAVVIGSGFGGLASAIRLQARGVQVTLLEQREKIGGRAYQWQAGGFTFDMGPSLITAPEVMNSLYQSAGTSLSQELPLQALDPYYRVYFHDKSKIDYNGNPSDMKTQMAQFNPGDARRFDAFMSRIRPIYEEIFDKGMGTMPFHDPKVMAGFVPTALRLGAFLPAARFTQLFFRDFRHQFLFSFHPLFVGGNPFKVPAIYLMIPYLERKQGVWYTEGGMYSFVKSLERVFLRLGGEVRTSSPARQIGVSNGRVSGVHTDSGTIASDLVVSNADVGFTYKHLIAASHRKKWTDQKVNRLQYSMSCFLIFIGVRKKYPQLEHHTLILAERYKGLVNEIFAAEGLPDDFSMYVHAPSRTDKTMAPEGMESLYILAPVPNNKMRFDWSQNAEWYKKKILLFLERWGLEDLNASIAVEKIFTPDDFRDSLLSMHGNAFGPEPQLFQTGYFRPHNRSEDVRNLYFSGSGSHPGAGVPGVLMSAEATETCVLEDFPHLRTRSPKAHSSTPQYEHAESSS